MEMDVQVLVWLSKPIGLAQVETQAFVTIVEMESFKLQRLAMMETNFLEMDVLLHVLLRQASIVLDFQATVRTVEMD